MNMDVFIFVAFCIFLLLIILRLKDKLSSKSDLQEVESYETGIKVKSIRTWWLIIQLLVLCALLVPMTKYLYEDFMHLDNRSFMEVGVRVLLFVFAIILLITRITRLFRHRNLHE